MKIAANIYHDVMHLFYPHNCTGCGSDLIAKENLLCINCIRELPHTGFAGHPDNLIEKIFSGRLVVKAAYSQFYFSKGKLIQSLIHRLKYKQDRLIGFYLGEIMGNSILASSRFSGIDYLIPLPLYPDKEFKRGYNQAEIICHGISASTQIPVMNKNVIRINPTETQTRKRRTERWQNVEGSFSIINPEKLTGKNVLLIDDVITTGATLEACGQAILNIPRTTLYLGALAHASQAG